MDYVILRTTAQKRTTNISSHKLSGDAEMETVNKPLVDPIEALLLRLLHGGLDDLDIATELCGSLGFMETVKSVTCKTLGLESEDEQRLFADKWCELNP